MLPPCWRGMVADGGTSMSLRWFFLRLLALPTLGALAACAGGDREPPAAADPSFYRSMAAAGAAVDATTAASMISGYRRNNGLSTVTVDPELMKLAQTQAQAMA